MNGWKDQQAEAMDLVEMTQSFTFKISQEVEVLFWVELDQNSI